MQVQVYTSEQLREELLRTRGWVFRDDDWENAYRWSLEGRELIVCKRDDGTVFAGEILE